MAVIFTLIVSLFLVLTESEAVPQEHAVHFQQGTTYWYNFEGSTTINEAGTFFAEATVGIAALNDSIKQDHAKQHCRLIVQNYIVHGITDDSQKEVHMDFSKWTSFEIGGDGQITAVFYTKSEEPLILSMKKIILSLISTKLVISKSQEDKGKRWGYEANETSHEGHHRAIYQVEPSTDKLTFTKSKQDPQIKGAHHKYKKVLTLHRRQNVPHTFYTQEEFLTPHDAVINKNEESKPKTDTTDEPTMRLPPMGGKSHMSLTMESMVHNDKYSTHNKTDLIKTTLLSDKIPYSRMNFTEMKNYLQNNVSCIDRYKDSKRAIPCFNNLVHMIRHLSLENIYAIVNIYRKSSNWLTIIDGLGAAKTNDSWLILLDEVFKNQNASAKELMHGLVHFVDIKDCLPWSILNLLEKKVFTEPWIFPDDHVTNQVNDRTILMLGSVVQSEAKCNKTWARSMTRELESIVGVHDPYHHRTLRATKTDTELKNIISSQCLHLNALGNAAQPSSYEYFVSYLNTSESHMQLRFSAVHAISNYQNEKSAKLILTVALKDEEDNIRLTAIENYKKHPFGGDLNYFVERDLYRYNNLTDVEHVRMKRDINEVLGRIWQGFHFRLEAPSVDWKKVIGGPKLGASVGILLKNLLDVKIAPLSGHLLVDVHDKAWATIHAGIIGIDFDIFRAEICFKGKIEYNLNILSEFGFDDINSLADLYNNNILKIIDTVKTTITTFKELVQKLKDSDIGDLIADFVDAVKALPKGVTHLRKVARKVLKSLEDHADLPPVYTLIKELVLKVTKLFNDIKTDVMNLYNAIVDTVATTIPWAWEELKTAFNDIAAAFKNILKNPKTSFQNMGKGVLRITTAVVAVLNAKDKIVEANIFDKENRPYWFDIQTVFEDIWKETEEIKKAIDHTIDEIKEDDDDGEARRYTGVDLV